jgi:RNA polymerase sigma-70 factor (ECF subfamily)
VTSFVLRRVHRDRAADVVEETFLAAWRRLDEAPGDARLWLYGIARGVVANDRRSQLRAGALVRRLLGVAGEATPDHAVDAGQGPAWEAFRRLPSRDREVVALVAWEDLDIAEIAAVLGCSEGAVRVRLHRARARLTRLRDEIEGDPAAPPPAPPAEDIP